MRVKSEKRIGDKKILLLLLEGKPPRTGRKNIVAVNNTEDIMWIAELPTEIYDSYYELKYKDGVLYAKSSNSYMAVINPSSGEIINKYVIY